MRRRTRRPAWRKEDEIKLVATRKFLAGGGQAGALIRGHDWAATPLGTPDRWPPALRATLSACLNSPILGAVLWGPELLFLYNDAYVPPLADRHPAAMGRPAAEVWLPAWAQVAPEFHRAMRTGAGFMQAGVELPIMRHGVLETTVWNFTAAPIRGEDGGIAGLLHQGVEITAQLRAERAGDAAENDLRALTARLEASVEQRTRERGRLWRNTQDIPTVIAEKEQARALRLHENIVQSDTAPICAFDTNFKLIAFNRAHNDEFFRVHGFYTKIGDVFCDLFVPAQRLVMRALMARALTGEIFTVVEEFGNPEIGVPHWEITYTPLRDEAGGIIGAFHYARDVSPRLRAEAELRIAQDALRQAQKMEAVGQLTGGLAHDFNNLLTGITGSLELMQLRLEQGRAGEVGRYVGTALGAARRAAALIHRLLAFSRRQTLAPKPTDVNHLVTGMEELIRRTVGPAITLETRSALALWPSLIDPSQLESAVLNLCINARDAMPDGGTITIESENLLLDERMARERGVEPGPYILLSVSDTGTGMDASVIEKAFDPFFTTKPIGMGTGLGLSMIYGFAKQSGGSVGISSEVGVGSTVWICLPRHLGQANFAAAAREAAVPPPAVQGTIQDETVLVVDDEPAVRMLAADVLEELGYTALEAADGAAGLTLLNCDLRIDLLVTDVGLPGGMNGRQLADAARAKRPGLKVLFITGYAESAVLSHGQLDPGMHILTKPFTMEALANRIRRLIAET